MEHPVFERFAFNRFAIDCDRVAFGIRRFSECRDGTVDGDPTGPDQLLRSAAGRHTRRGENLLEPLTGRDRIALIPASGFR